MDMTTGGSLEVRTETTTYRQVGFEMIFLAAVLVALKFFVHNTAAMSVFIAVNIILRFALIGRKGDLIFFLIGFVAGGGNDYLSMVKDVYYYTPEHILPAPIPVWMLFFWGHIFVAFRQLFQLPPFQGGPHGPHPWKLDFRLVLDIATAIVLRIIIYNFVRQEPIPTLGYAGVLVLRLVILPPKRNEWLLMIVATALGVLYEGGLIGLGLYVYYDAVFLGMPAWLIIYWTFILPILMKGLFDRIETSLALRGTTTGEVISRAAPRAG